MAKSQETFNKKEKEKKRLQKRKEKEQRREERKAAKEGKSEDDMIAYVDEFGNISSTPPDPTKKQVVKESDIDLESRNKGGSSSASFSRRGRVTSYHASKGFGFIKDEQWGDDIFFHRNSLNFEVQVNDRVTFDTEMGPKGRVAVNVKKSS